MIRPARKTRYSVHIIMPINVELIANRTPPTHPNWFESKPYASAPKYPPAPMIGLTVQLGKKHVHSEVNPIRLNIQPIVRNQGVTILRRRNKTISSATNAIKT